jgi:hypothetical protein
VPNSTSWNSSSKIMISAIAIALMGPTAVTMLNSMPLITATGTNTSAKPRLRARNGSQLTISARRPVTRAAPSLIPRNQIRGIAK